MKQKHNVINDQPLARYYSILRYFSLVKPTISSRWLVAYSIHELTLVLLIHCIFVTQPCWNHDSLWIMIFLTEQRSVYESASLRKFISRNSSTVPHHLPHFLDPANPDTLPTLRFIRINFVMIICDFKKMYLKNSLRNYGQLNNWNYSFYILNHLHSTLAHKRTELLIQFLETSKVSFNNYYLFLVNNYFANRYVKNILLAPNSHEKINTFANV